MTFVSADKAEFKNRYRIFAKVLDENAFDFFAHLNTEDSFTAMRVVTECLDAPALAGIVKSVTQAVLDTPAEHVDRLKMAIGALVSFIMTTNGFRKTGKKKAVPPVLIRIFRSGEVFERGVPGESTAGPGKND